MCVYVSVCLFIYLFILWESFLLKCFSESYEFIYQHSQMFMEVPVLHVWKCMKENVLLAGQWIYMATL